VWRRLRLYFLTGLVVLSPVVVTIYVFWLLFSKVDGILSGVFDRLGVNLWGYPPPGLGFLTVLLIILLTGIFARNYVGSKLIEAGNRILGKIPLMNRIYVAVQQISHALLAGEKASFRQAVLFEYPRKGIYSIGFLTSESWGEVQEKTKKKTVNVFLPTTPNPTSGYLLVIPQKDVVPLDMTIEEALKLIISGGTVVPEARLEKIIKVNQSNSSL